MEQTTNPFLVMGINMTIVFAVLIALGILIQITYYLDPTRKRAAKPAATPAATTPAPVAAPAAAPIAKDNDDQVIAAISAAIVAMGYSSSQIASIRPQRNSKWALEGRLVGRQ